MFGQPSIVRVFLWLAIFALDRGKLELYKVRTVMENQEMSWDSKIQYLGPEKVMEFYRSWKGFGIYFYTCIFLH